MSFLGLTPAGNYDRTAQQAGVPRESSPRPLSYGDDDMSNDHDEHLTRTRSVSRAETHHAEKEPQTAESSNDTQVDEDSEMERRESIVNSLARRYTTQSQANGGVNPFIDVKGDSPLNPSSASFNARAWAKAFVELASGTEHGFRHSGVAFQNLNVHGFGAATDYQKSVGNIWLEGAQVFRTITGAKKTKIDILRNFDGLVRKGEMLVVLGPPGAGCSTFLKTITGETSGIYIDDQSYFNYQGTDRLRPPNLWSFQLIVV